MKIILSPAKKMKVDTDSIDTMSSPVFLEKNRRNSWVDAGKNGRRIKEIVEMQ